MTNCNSERGTGRTTRQMQEAPKGAVFVWPNRYVMEGKEFARRIGRADLEVISPDQLQWDYFAGRTITGLVIDHAVTLTLSQDEALVYFRSRIRTDGNKGA